MSTDQDHYTPLTETEKVIIYNFLDQVKASESFKQAVLTNPELTLSLAKPTVSFADLLRPNILEILGKLRRVALEEIGVDVSNYRDSVGDNGFKMMADNKR